VDRVFISYSRQQLYFAESLAFRLQERGITVWFDLQQLKPGCDWQDEIEAGLETSNALVLIASRSALASPFVEREWKVASALHKPIYVVLYEAVVLPLELQDAPVIDFRRDFDYWSRELAVCLQKRTSIHHPVPSPVWAGIPAQMPRSVWMVILALLASTVSTAPFGIFITFELFPGSVSTVAPIALASSVWMGFTAWQFVQHRSSYWLTRYALVFPLLSGWAVLFIALAVLASPLTNDPRVPPPVVPLILVVMSLVGTIICGAAYLWAMTYSEDVLRWFSAGNVPRNLRLKLNARLIDYLDTSKRYTGQAAKLEIHYDPADEHVSRAVQKAIPKEFLNSGRVSKRLTSNRTESGKTFHIAILTNNTSQELVRNWIDAYEKTLVCIVASTIEIPEHMSKLSQYQWIDYRMQAREQLEALLQDLASGGIGVQSSLNTDPGNIGNLQTPWKVLLFALPLRLLAAYHVIWGLFSLMTLLGIVHSNLPLNAGGIIGLTIGLVEFWLAGAAIKRRITFWLLGATLLAINGLAMVIGIGPLVHTSMSMLQAGALEGMIPVVTFFPSLWNWLPSRLQRSAAILGNRVEPRIWSVHALCTLCLLALGLAMPIAGPVPTQTDLPRHNVTPQPTMVPGYSATLAKNAMDKIIQQRQTFEAKPTSPPG
jgi:hypothetical protein